MEDRGETDIELIYESHREGLAPMVEGLITGLAKRFKQDIEIRQTGWRTPDSPEDRFHIHIKP